MQGQRDHFESKQIQKPILCKFTVKCSEWLVGAVKLGHFRGSWGALIQSETLCGEDTHMEEAQSVLITPQHFFLCVARPHAHLYVRLHTHTEAQRGGSYIFLIFFYLHFHEPIAGVDMI